MVAIGLVGCGAIGSRLAYEIEHRLRGTARLIGIYDRNLSSAHRLAKRLKLKVPILPPEKLIPRCKLLIEAASQKAVGELLPKVVAHRRSILVMSAGGLLKVPRLLKRAIALKVPVYLPSGACAGLDGIKSAALGGLKEVVLTTRKPPQAYSGAPEVLRRRIRLSEIRSPRLLFQGSARRAIAKFPQNVNVAATLALAGIGPVRTRVRVVADPYLRVNIHEIKAVGRFGKMTVRLENRPSRENPKTSELAVFSAVETLRQIFQSTKIGT